jgi:cysteinyl-tRNA synthetase
MREIRLHDTRGGEVRALQPRDPGRIGIYACGPTVYGRIHLGNARPFVIFSLMKRFLKHEGFEVTLVINITDVNDKIYEAARAADVASDELAREMTRAYIADTDALGLGRPDHEPLASEYMPQIVAYIEALVDSGHAYVVPYEGNEDGAPRADVFFRVRSDAGYGSLSHRRLDDMDQGEGIEGAERKQDPLDFALWKARKADEDTSWPSPWGEGRPGWHIECSAMAEGLLGVELDVHGGGSDLVFPHHENEAAQTRAARGQELARMWVHNGMVQSTGEKMAKSVGNIAPLHEVLERHGRDAVVLYLASGHYRQPLAFSEAALGDARQQVLRIREALRRLGAGEASPPEMTAHTRAFFDALADDFNTPKALASLFEWVREANRRAQPTGDRDLREMLSVLGFDELAPLEAVADLAAVDPKAAELLDLREQARSRRDFSTADRLREEIAALGFELRDGPAGPELVRRA